eukprot:2708204-Pyramimonas_sp.AAC.1
MKARAGLGVDRLSPTDFERLPQEGLQDTCDLFAMVEEGLTWPWQVMCMIGGLLAKRSGGDRVTGLLPMLCRAWSMARE